MVILRYENEGAVTAELKGRLDTLGAEELDRFLEEEPCSLPLTLDFAGVDYVSSAGLRVLLRAHNRTAPHGGMKLVNVAQMIKEIFEVTGFSEILTVE
jgi:anti-sigma B factor antagonist